MHPVLGEYGIGDIKFVAAFDVDQNKVGLTIFYKNFPIYFYILQ